MAPNLWQFQLYIIFNMPIEICGKTREFENRRGKNNNNNENKSDINKCWAYFLWQVCAALAALFFFVTLAPEWPTGLRVQFRVRVSVSGLSMPSNRRRCLEELPSSSPTAVRGGRASAALGTCWHFSLSRAFLKCLPFRPRNPGRQAPVNAPAPSVIDILMC